MQTGGKMQTEGKMQTADCRPEVKCRPRRSREILPKIAKIVAMITSICHTQLSNKIMSTLNEWFFPLARLKSNPFAVKVNKKGFAPLTAEIQRHRNKLGQIVGQIFLFSDWASDINIWCDVLLAVSVQINAVKIWNSFSFTLLRTVEGLKLKF